MNFSARPNRAVTTQILILFQLFSLIGQITPVWGQSNTSVRAKVVDNATYRRVLDIVFEDIDKNPRETIYSFGLRFRPYSEPESQIIIRRKANEVEIIEMHADGAIIFNSLNNKINRTGQTNPELLAKDFRVKKRVLAGNIPQAKRWFTSFFQSLSSFERTMQKFGEKPERERTETIFLHGGFYVLNYEQSLNNLSLEVYDVDIPELADSSTYRITRWMDSIRREIKDLK